jgi:hypothetical protein
MRGIQVARSDVTVIMKEARSTQECVLSPVLSAICRIIIHPDLSLLSVKVLTVFLVPTSPLPIVRNAFRPGSDTLHVSLAPSAYQYPLTFTLLPAPGLPLLEFLGFFNTRCLVQ